MRTDREEEFRAYVAEGRPGLLRTATLLAGGDRHLAEDLVQTALTRVYLAWPRIRKTGSPQGYARRTLVNALIDEQRRPFRKRETSRAELPEIAAASDGGAGAGGLQRIGDVSGAGAEADGSGSTRLQRALAGLPPGMRAAVVFRHVHELSVAETAEALGCSQGNVKSQTARGLDRLRTALADSGPPGRSHPDPYAAAASDAATTTASAIGPALSRRSS